MRSRATSPAKRNAGERTARPTVIRSTSGCRRHDRRDRESERDMDVSDSVRVCLRVCVSEEGRERERARDSETDTEGACCLSVRLRVCQREGLCVYV
jgi:hypothetical protein